MYDKYKEAAIPMQERNGKKRLIYIRVRVFNDGVAFRYEDTAGEAPQTIETVPISRLAVVGFTIAVPAPPAPTLMELNVMEGLPLRTFGPLMMLSVEPPRFGCPSV